MFGLARKFKIMILSHHLSTSPLSDKTTYIGSSFTPPSTTHSEVFRTGWIGRYLHLFFIVHS